MLLTQSDAPLQVNGLSAAYPGAKAPCWIVREVSFSIQTSEVVAILGESGSGKTTALLALMGLMPPGSTVSGSARFRGRELIGATERESRDIRGAGMAYIPPEPLLSLNPVIRAEAQVAQVARSRYRCGRDESHDRARAALLRVGLDAQFHSAYPHQLSGGQRQRVLIALAMVSNPALVIADEPTGSLDAISAREIMQLLRDLIQQSGISLLLVTHDPDLAIAYADRALVMYGGCIVEDGAAGEVLAAPLHPYTKGLLRSRVNPIAKAARADRHIPALEGSAPDFARLPAGCGFEPRCVERVQRCSEERPILIPSGTHQVSCFLYGRQ